MPEGWLAVRTGKRPTPVLAPGASTSVSRPVTAPGSVPTPVATADVEAAVGFRAERTAYAVDRTLTLTAGSLPRTPPA